MDSLSTSRAHSLTHTNSHWKHTHKLDTRTLAGSTLVLLPFSLPAAAAGIALVATASGCSRLRAAAAAAAAAASSRLLAAILLLRRRPKLWLRTCCKKAGLADAYQLLLLLPPAASVNRRLAHDQRALCATTCTTHGIPFALRAHRLTCAAATLKMFASAHTNKNLCVVCVCVLCSLRTRILPLQISFLLFITATGTSNSLVAVHVCVCV